jgi:hypothetical protein
MEYTREILDEIAEGARIVDGFDNCIIGIIEEFGGLPRILYSKKCILDKLQTQGIEDRLEALEYYDYNILGGYFGRQNPVFLDDEF